jgi:hypothetical protein
MAEEETNDFQKLFDAFQVGLEGLEDEGIEIQQPPLIPGGFPPKRAYMGVKLNGTSYKILIESFED